MALRHWPGALHRWLFPLLAAVLVLGHACELPAYAGLIVDHEAAADDAVPVGHGHDGDEHALSCDGALILPGQGTATPNPGLVMAIAALATATPAPGPASFPMARPIRSSAGPPLFLLFSALLI